MTSTKSLDAKLLKLLRRGARRIRSSYELADILGVSQRHIGFMVSRLRKSGHAIGSVHGLGYYIISNDAELAATVEHIQRRKKGIDETIKNLTEAYRGTSRGV